MNDRTSKDKSAPPAANDNRGKRPGGTLGEGSGEVTGSGAGAGGGGNPEDYDSDPVGGGGQATTATPAPAGARDKGGRDAPNGGMQ